MKVLSKKDKDFLTLAFRNGFKMAHARNIDNNEAFEDIILPDMGETRIVCNLLSGNHMRLERAYVKLGERLYKVDLEEFKGMYLFFIDVDLKGKRISLNTLYKGLCRGEGVQNDLLFSERLDYYSDGIIAYDKMKSEIIEMESKETRECYDGRFSQRIGTMTFSGECFYHKGKYEVTPEEYHKAMEELKFPEPVMGQRGFYRWDLDKIELFHRLNNLKDSDFFTSWATEDFIYNIVGDFIEVKSRKRNCVFFIAKPDNLYKKVIDNKGHCRVFRENTLCKL